MANLLQKLIFRSGILCYHCWWQCSNFTSMLYKHFERNVWKDFRLQISALATVARKRFPGEISWRIYCKNWFSDLAFYVTIADGKVLTLFCKTFLWLKQLRDAKILIQDYNLSVFKKLRNSDTCNQVKSSTKHGRPDLFQWKLTVAITTKATIA